MSDLVPAEERPRRERRQGPFVAHLSKEGVVDFLAGGRTVHRSADVKRWGSAVPGDLIVFKEGYWRRSYWANAEHVRGENVETDVRYFATDKRPVARSDDEFWEFRESIYLPKFAWRCWAEVTRVFIETPAPGAGPIARVEFKRVPPPRIEQP